MLEHTGKNMWRTNGRLNFPLNGLVLYAPLWHPQLSGSPFNAWDVANGTVRSCTVIGATVWGIQGRTFDGTDDWISIPNHATLNFTSQDFSVEVWFYLNQTGSTRTLVSKGQNAIPRVGWLFRIPSNERIALYVAESGTSKAAFTAVDVIVATTWTHVVVTRTGTTILLYKDGKVVANETNNTATDIDASSDAVRVGAEADDEGDMLGIIGEVRIYNRVLTPLEVQRNYLATKWRYL